MSKVRLLNGPCDPRDVEMPVSLDADGLYVRPMPFTCRDVYAVTDKFTDRGVVLVATAEYLHTEGPRRQTELYRKALARIGAARAFTVKRAVSA